jgi:hypothetical protein
MDEVRNLADKLVCRIDKNSKVIEIVSKGYKTIVYFLSNGQVKVINSKL